MEETNNQGFILGVKGAALRGKRRAYGGMGYLEQHIWVGIELFGGIAGNGGDSRADVFIAAGGDKPIPVDNIWGMLHQHPKPLFTLAQGFLGFLPLGKFFEQASCHLLEHASPFIYLMR